MDNPYYEIDKEDLARFRAGLQPIEKKEVVVDSTCVLTIDEVVKQINTMFKSITK